VTYSQVVDAVDPTDFLEQLTRRLPLHAALLHRLLTALAGQDRVVWVEVGCSIPTERADELSDIDMGLGHLGDPPIEMVDEILNGLGAVVDGGWTPWGEAARWWVQYLDGVQVDVVLMPADRRNGRAPGSIALLDLHGHLVEEFTPTIMHASEQDIDGWHLDGWEGLCNVAKYLARGSLHEAADQLHRVRQDCCRLWAVGEGVDYPAFGLTSLLDAPDATLPDGLDESHVGLRSEAIRGAALQLVDTLSASAEHARTGLTSPLRQWTLHRLATEEAIPEDASSEE
jgi:hypothetical protein